MPDRLGKAAAGLQRAGEIVLGVWQAPVEGDGASNQLDRDCVAIGLDRQNAEIVQAVERSGSIARTSR